MMRAAMPILLVAGLGLIVMSCGLGTESRNAAPHASSPRESRGSTDSSHREVTWTGAIDVAIGDAVEGPWRMNESTFHYVDDPTVAVREDGCVGVAWANNRLRDIFFQMYGADGVPRLATPVNVSRNQKVFSWLPRIVVSKDEVFVLWQEIVFSGGSHGGEIFFSRSTDGGKSFSAPLNLSGTTAGDGKGRLTGDRWDNGSLDLVRGDAGELLAAWTEYEGALWVSRSTDAGQTFSEPVRVAGSKRRPARGPSLATGREGRVYLAWTVGEDMEADIHFAVSTDSGRTFGSARVVFRTNGYSDAPKIAVDRRGVVHLLHGESPNGPFAESHVRYARLRHDETFEKPRTISGSDDGASFPSLALDGAGNVYAIWERHPDGRKHPGGLEFSVSRDGGETFTAPSIVPGTADRALGDNGGRQGMLMRKLAANDGGTLAVVNSHFREKERSRVRLIRGRFSRR